jgi:hypothetical protein
VLVLEQLKPTTSSPSTPKPITSSPSTPKPTTSSPSTPKPILQNPHLVSQLLQDPQLGNQRLDENTVLSQEKKAVRQVVLAGNYDPKGVVISFNKYKRIIM